MGEAYLRYSFGRGTEREVARVAELCDLAPGVRVLDVGCGPGRHVSSVADLGCEVIGVDLSERFVSVGAAREPRARFVQADAALLPVADASVDVVLSVCQGAFGMAAGPPPAVRTGGVQRPAAAEVDPDGRILAEMARVLRPGGRLVLTAFSAYFQLRWLEETDAFDAERGVNHEHTEIHDEVGARHPAELWTSCFTPRELRLLLDACGLECDAMFSVRPGDWAQRPVTVDEPELLVVATRATAGGRPDPRC
ncbi:MAG: class I SAM-dependent methyltransferase [Acidimicrobiia bacterium]|nr:class I SAM-dependent methyltransferase [Acidimicrobiia bacterium]